MVTVISSSAWISPGRHACEVMTDDVFKKYDYPITASVITSEIEKNGDEFFNQALIDARQMFA